MSTADDTHATRRGSGCNDLLGQAPERDDLGWHALNYRTAHTVHAEIMWQELSACVDRRVAIAVAAERERCAKLCAQKAAFWAARAKAGDMNGDTARHACIAAGQIEAAIRGA